MHHYEKS